MKRNEIRKLIRLDLSYEVFWITKRRLELANMLFKLNWTVLKWETFKIQFAMCVVQTECEKKLYMSSKKKIQHMKCDIVYQEILKFDLCWLLQSYDILVD